MVSAGRGLIANPGVPGNPWRGPIPVPKNAGGAATLGVSSNPPAGARQYHPLHPSVTRSPGDLPSIDAPSTDTPTGTDIQTIDAFRADAICILTVRSPAMVESSSTLSSGGATLISGASPSIVRPRLR